MIVAAKQPERTFDAQGHSRVGIRIVEFIDDKIDNFREASPLQCGVRSCLGDGGRIVFIDVKWLALQLHFRFEMGAACFGLVSSSPE